ncbi:MAG: rhomboid family intramembrane serine protease [Pseudomonadota bacterium]
MFLLPFRDHNPSGRTAYVTYLLIAANVLVFLVTLPAMGDARAGAILVLSYGLVPADATITSALTSMFLHGGPMHLAGNMLFLWIYGDNMEDEFGHVGFAAFYVVCGIVAGFAHVAFNPGSGVPLVGASGAIAGVMGAYLMFYPRARIDVFLLIVVFFRVIPVPAWIVLAFWFVTQIFSGVATGGADGAGVAYWAHAGGFLAGIAAGLPLFLKHGGPAHFWRESHGVPPHPEAVYRRSSVPRAGRRIGR